MNTRASFVVNGQKDMGLSLTSVSDGDRLKGPLQKKLPFGGSSCKPCKCLQEDIVTRSFSAQQTENRVKKYSPLSLRTQSS